jgi:hypothetical protein
MGLGGWGNWRVNPVRGSVLCVGNPRLIGRPYGMGGGGK